MTVTTEELLVLAAKLGIRVHRDDISHYLHSTSGAEILRERLSYGRRLGPDSISPAAALLIVSVQNLKFQSSS